MSLGLMVNSVLLAQGSALSSLTCLQQLSELCEASAQPELVRALPDLLPTSLSNGLAGIQILVLNPFCFIYSDP